MVGLRYYKSAFWTLLFGIILAATLGYRYEGSALGAAQTIFLVLVLSILEVSLSVDNSVVDATILRRMTPVWRHRFLTWGMLIGVFGMRLVFPLLIVGFVAQLAPWEALRLAALQPDEYARIMRSMHVPVAAFGGAFLLMVALKYFFDQGKDIHWIRLVEEPLAKLGRMEAIEIAIAMITLYGISRAMPMEQAHSFLVSGFWGLITFIGVDGIGAFLEAPESAIQDAHRTSAGLFLYLEVLDASFSFDGVVGALAITNNLFYIAIGLGIGAMFVRSTTIMLVEKGTLTEFRFLEHGAFYAIGALAVMMFLNTFVHVPEVLTGLVGAAFIGLSLWSSLHHKRLAQAD